MTAEGNKCDPSAAQKALIEKFLDIYGNTYAEVEWKDRWLRAKLVGEEQWQEIADIWPQSIKRPLVELDRALWDAEHECCTCKTLDEKLKNHPPASRFFPHAFYNAAGDQIDVYWENESAYSESMHDKYGYNAMSVDRSQEDKRIVGCSIFSISILLQQAGFRLVKIKDEEDNQGVAQSG